jgi:hypothetical protein
MFDIKKFFAGFNIFDGEKVGKIIYFIIIISLCLIVYNIFTRPTTKVNVGKGGKATIIQNKSKNWGVGGNIQSDKTIGVSVMYFF